MYTDKNLRVSTEQAITSGTPLSTDSVDLTVARDIGEGKSFYAYVTVQTTFTGGNGLAVQVITGTGVDSNGQINAGIQVIGASDSIPVAALLGPTGQKSGYVYAIRINPLVAGITASTASQENRGARYLGLRYVADGTFGAGKVNAEFVVDIQDGRKAYSSGFTVV
jgi:hypothetical protein